MCKRQQQKFIFRKVYTPKEFIHPDKPWIAISAPLYNGKNFPSQDSPKKSMRHLFSNESVLSIAYYLPPPSLLYILVRKEKMASIDILYLYVPVPSRNSPDIQ